MTETEPPEEEAAGGGPTPAAVLAVAGGEAVRPVWDNAVGGRTFEIGAGERRRFVKWQPAGRGPDLAAEATRLAWAVAYTPVPRLLGQGRDAEGAWIVTSPVAGTMAVARRWRADPRTAVTAIGVGACGRCTRPCRSTGARSRGARATGSPMPAGAPRGGR
jgi:kanamycin kinase